MSKYGDDYTCTCEMNLVSCRNNFHADDCELWLEPSFKDGADCWDGDLGLLVLAGNPWENAEEWVWNGDEPVVRKVTAQERTITTEVQELIEAWAGVKQDDTETVNLIPEGEQEVLDELTAGTAKVDDVGMVAMADGSYADMECRVTYRRITGDDGQPTWVEELWDVEGLAAVIAEDEAPVECVCMPPKRFYCHVCKVQRVSESDLWSKWDGTTRSSAAYSATPSSTSWGSYTWSKCSHCLDVFELPGKQTRNIRISKQRTHTAETTPDYGLYAYTGWNPKCVATFIPWQDYGLPTVPFKQAAQAIQMAYNLAIDGKMVEVGCMGGHGRTGTILACMAILSDPEMAPRAAVKHVRDVHCKEAIETNEQEWFVAWFKSWLTGQKCPPKPTTYVTKHSANWGAANTAAKAVAGSAGPLPLTSHAGGPVTEPNAWCQHCHRHVVAYHNGDCPDYEKSPGLAEERKQQEAVIAFDGPTANARRRNAKRANRRAARAKRSAMRRGD